MIELRFLSQDDLIYLRPFFKASTIRYDKPTLERGDIQIIDGSPKPTCEMIVRQNGMRYRTEAYTREFPIQESERKVLPVSLNRVARYGGSFAFDYGDEMRFFQILRQYYELGMTGHPDGIDAATYVRLGEIAGLSKRDFHKKIGAPKKPLQGRNSAVAGAVIGAFIFKDGPGAIFGAGIGGSIETTVSHLVTVQAEKRSSSAELNKFLSDRGINLGAVDAPNVL